MRYVLHWISNFLPVFWGLHVLHFVSQVGHSIHIGGLVRLDIEELSTDSLYVTVWASPLLPLHMGRTENASTMLEEHFGRQLQVQCTFFLGRGMGENADGS